MNPEQSFQDKSHLFATCNHLLSESKLDDKAAAKLIGCTVRKIENLKAGEFKKIGDEWLEETKLKLEGYNASWIKNTGEKPSFDRVDVRFDNCKSNDSALGDKSVFGAHPDEFVWFIGIGDSEITHYRQSI